MRLGDISSTYKILRDLLIGVLYLACLVLAYDEQGLIGLLCFIGIVFAISLLDDKIEKSEVKSEIKLLDFEIRLKRLELSKIEVDKIGRGLGELDIVLESINNRLKRIEEISLKLKQDLGKNDNGLKELSNDNTY